MALTDKYRILDNHEVESLKKNGCRCSDWTRVRVKDGFDPSMCINCTFSGDITLGVFSEPYTDESGVSVPSGLLNARLHNCNVGSDVIISNIGDYIANYNIEDNVVIRNCGKIHTEGISTFGNGTVVSVLNETGGRSVKIWDRLSAHEAYIIALYRHRKRAIEIIGKMVEEYSATIASGKGTISHHSRIFNCNTLRNVRVGPFSYIEGSMTLNEGSVNSTEADPVYIGSGVIMEHFIVCSGSVVKDSTLVDKCFIGQGCVLAKHYSAENSLFFANSAGFHGEACSIFAGPYTVTHHKSTLLIAGIFSFMNAGSGSNQSNHMYKLGPIHQGIMERGSKTTSDSYLLWPARIGPFTLVMGRHYKNMDTSSLPFSYLIESNDESILVPAINLRSVGTIRDAQKWPLRDRRKDTVKTDQVNFNLLSPYTIRKMFAGREILRKLKTESPLEVHSYRYNSMLIKKESLDRGIELYQTGINKFLGNSLIKRLEKREFRTNEELQERLRPDRKQGKGEWVDIAGLIAPKKEIDNLLDDIESGRISDIQKWSGSFAEIHKSYYDWEWTWSCQRIEEEEGKPVDTLRAEDVIRIVTRWKKSVIDLDNLLYEDARKEFNLSSRTGFGIDDGEDVKKLDFEEVRGEFESNGVVAAIQEHIRKKSTLGDELIDRMKRVGLT
jgi:carbonic anhydrase/acetyltransferase-like protein (isoleucine patch superfamily)